MVLYAMPCFVVHEHHSKQLHYDFRLEIDGVLKSWAVPKGPSLSPTDRRLAVMVEDHPLEYGRFEGRIRAGSYGAGPVLIWDSGPLILVKQDFLKGQIEFLLEGRKLKGAFVLTRLKSKERDWLLIKKNDQFASPHFTIAQELTPERLQSLEEKAPPCEADGNGHVTPRERGDFQAQEIPK
jgi:bifunctional non-homologous end joining protein LigD